MGQAGCPLVDKAPFLDRRIYRDAYPDSDESAHQRPGGSNGWCVYEATLESAAQRAAHRVTRRRRAVVLSDRQHRPNHRAHRETGENAILERIASPNTDPIRLGQRELDATGVGLHAERLCGDAQQPPLGRPPMVVGHVNCL